MASDRSGWQRIRVPSAPLAGDTLTIGTAAQAFASTVPIGVAMFTVGRSFRFEVYGVMSTVAAVSITAKLYLGQTLLAASPSINVSVLGSNLAWYGRFGFDVMTAGAGGLVEAQGYGNFALTGGAAVVYGLSNVAPVAVDLSADRALSTVIQGSVLSVGNTITQRKIIAEATTN